MSDAPTPHACAAGHDGEMLSPTPCRELLWLRSIATEHKLTTQQIAVFVMILSFREGECAKITKAELGALVGLCERQVATVLKQLEAHIVGFIKASRAGRSGNSYSFNQQLVAGNSLPVTGDNRRRSAGKAALVMLDNQQPTAVQPNSVRQQNSNPLPIENPRASISTPARAQTQPSNNYTPELNPERVESSINHPSREKPLHVLNGNAVRMTGMELAGVLVERCNSPHLDPAKFAGLHTSSGRLKALVDAGADFDADILPTVSRIVANARKPIQTWGYFERAITEATADRLRAEQAIPTIQASEAIHGQSPSPAYAADGAIVRRERISPATAARRQRRAEREAGNQPIDLGRMDSLALK